MKIKTSEAEGEVLNRLVAKCEGIELESGYGVQETSGYYNRLLVDGSMSKGQSMLVRYIPSTDWTQGGPIIERERIAIWWEKWDDIDSALPVWGAVRFNEKDYYGATPLIAAMRCYVASKLGDEVDIPEGVQT